MKLLDAHCHLQLSQYDTDRDQIISHMRNNLIGAVVIGVDLKTSSQAIALSEQHDFLWAAVGLHPNDNLTEEFDMVAFEELAKHPKVVAVGECGLDYFRSGGTDEERAAQKERFLKQIELAEKVQKTIIIHCRNAHDDMLQILTAKKPSVPIIIHFFTGSGELAEKYLNLGCYLSFPGPITYTEMYDESIRVCSLDKMLAETDAPFAAPVPNRGKRNEPAYVEHVVHKLANIKDVTSADMARLTVENAKKVFGIA